MTLKDAMELVVSDAEIKEIHFTSPIALMGSTKRAAEVPINPRLTKAQRRAAAVAAKGGKGNPSKGKGKGKGEGKGKGKNKNMVGNTPDGRQICFAFNSEAGCAGGCGRAHVCRRRGCQKEHSILQCSMEGA